jgi:hypothetical protein
MVVLAPTSSFYPNRRSNNGIREATKSEATGAHKQEQKPYSAKPYPFAKVSLNQTAPEQQFHNQAHRQKSRAGCHGRQHLCKASSTN